MSTDNELIYLNVQITTKQNEMLNQLSNVSKLSKAALVREALQLLFKRPKEKI